MRQRLSAHQTAKPNQMNSMPYFKSSAPLFLAALLLLGTFLFLVLSPSAQHQPASPNTSDVQFVDVAWTAGIRHRVVNGGEKTKKYIFESTGSGVAVFDYDGDGRSDLFVVNGSRLEGFPPGREPTNHLYRNQGNAAFVDVTDEAGVVRSGWGQGVCAGDYDNDGNVDLYVTYYGSSNALYHNTGKGRLDDVTSKAAVAGGKRNWSTGSAFVDYDNDGFLDLFVAGYVDLELSRTPLPGDNKYCLWRGVPVFCGPRGLPAAKNHLYRNNRNGTFTDVSLKSGIQATVDCYGMSVIASDLRNRGRPDIYVACDSTPSLLYHNNGDGSFREIGAESGVAYNPDGFVQAGMGVSVGDYDGDGRLDIFKTNFEDDVPDLYHNKGNGTFSFETYDAKLGFRLQYLSWGGGFFDFDNDGWYDLFIANGHVYPEPEARGLGGGYRQQNLLYRNLGNGTFDDVTGVSGSGLELKRSGRGVGFGDLDNDGDLEIVVNNQNDLPTLLRNDGGNRRKWIQVKLIGTRSNRDGIGARVSLLANHRNQIDEVRSGGSYLSQSDTCLHFGLGEAEVADEVTVHWPSGTVDRIQRLAPNQRLFIQEGKGLLQTGALPRALPSRNPSGDE